MLLLIWYTVNTLASKHFLPGINLFTWATSDRKTSHNSYCMNHVILQWLSHTCVFPVPAVVLEMHCFSDFAQRQSPLTQRRLLLWWNEFSLRSTGVYVFCIWIWRWAVEFKAKLNRAWSTEIEWLSYVKEIFKYKPKGNLDLCNPDQVRRSCVSSCLNFRAMDFDEILCYGVCWIILVEFNCSWCKIYITRKPTRDRQCFNYFWVTQRQFMKNNFT